MQATVRKMGDDRRDERFGACTDAALEPVGGETFAAAMIDISRHGCRLMVEGSVEVESLVWLKVGEYPALLIRVAWLRDDVIGCEFLEPLNRVAFSALSKRFTR